MNIENYNYKLPKKLIAQYPTKNRSDSRLLCVSPNSENLKDLYFKDFIKLIRPNDLIIFNNTKVIKARLFGKKETGGKIEILIEQVLDNQKALAMIKSSKKINLNFKILLSENYVIKILEKKIGEIKNEDNKTNQIIDKFSNFDSISFSSGMMIGRLFNSFYYQHRRILKRSPNDMEFDEFLEFIKSKLG